MPSPDVIDFRQRRSVAETLNATFVFIRDEFKSLVTVLLVLVGLPALLSAVFAAQSYDWLGVMFSGDPEAVVAALEGDEMFGWSYVLAVILQMLIIWFSVGLIYSYAILYVNRGRGGFSPAEVWAFFRSRWWPYLSTIFWGILLSIGCLVLFIIPIAGMIAGMLLFIYIYVIAMMVVVLRMEGVRVSFWAAFSKMRRMLRGYWVPSAALLVVSMMTVGILSSALSGTVMLAYGMLYSFLGSGVIATLMGVLLSLVSLVAYVLHAIVVIAFVLWYFGLKEVAEGVVLEQRIEEMALRDGGLDPLAL